MSVQVDNFEQVKQQVELKEEYDILKEGLVDMTKLMHKNSKYFYYDKEELELLILQYHDILEHTNVFIIELREARK